MREQNSVLPSLPNGWAYGKVGELADVVRGITFPKEEKIGIPRDGYLACLRTTNVQRKVEWDDILFIPAKYMRNERQSVKPGDILISTANSLELVGKVAQVENLPFPATIGAFISIIRPCIDPKFAYFQLSSLDVQSSLRDRASTTTNISNISTTDIIDTTLRVSPLPEQHRIVAKIEELFTRLEPGVEALKKIKLQLKRYHQSVLKSAFEGKLTAEWREAHKDILKLTPEPPRKAKDMPPVDASKLPEIPAAWIWARLGTYSSLITKGESPKWQGFTYVEEGIPFIRSENVLWGYLNFSTVTNIPKEFHQKLKRSKVKPDDVVINIVGASIGRCAVVPSIVADANINQAVALIRTNDALLPCYLMHVLISPQIQKDIRAARVETARPNISLADLNNLVIPLPSVIEQRRIIEEIERYFSLADEIEKVVERSLAQGLRLRHSILKRAFGGKLVPQDPSDEPAEKLLERIKAEKARRVKAGMNKCKHLI
jgi:type I restriction enzyme S subunit